MPYLNLDPHYFEHPKTRRLVGILGPMSDVLPIRLWAYCARVHPKDGRMKGYSVSEVEGVIGWHGDPKKAVEGLGRAGFILEDKTGFRCVDWHQHQGHLEAFSRRGKQAAKARWSKYATSNAPSIKKRCLGNTPSVPSVPHQPTTDSVEVSARKKTKHQTLMDRYLSECLGVKVGDPESKGKVSAAYSEFGKAAKNLLALSDDDPDKAMKAVHAIGNFMRSKDLAWNLRTVAKHSLDYFQSPDKYTGAAGNNSIDEWDLIREQTRLDNIERDRIDAIIAKEKAEAARQEEF